VSGKPQEEYVKRLGFKDSQIRLGFYTANRKIFETKQLECNSEFNKKFYFVGRYIHKKGILDLEKAFIEIQNEFPNEWELNCIGHGPLSEKMCNHPKINHIGFVQPIDLRKYISKGGVFILPSHFEPWGLVVHEFSMAGFPLIVSNAVGSANQFVLNDKNGYIFQSKSVDALKDSMLKIINSSNEKLFDMSKNSIKQSRLINEMMWIKTIDDILSSGKS
jgi:glycosyltransferase involved in cell wall biosynthesis